MLDELNNAAAAAEKARAVYVEAERRKDEAYREATRALNALNEAQKAFDAVVTKMRGEAPRDSDWKAAERRKLAVAA